jgi:hypothetical protein
MGYGAFNFKEFLDNLPENLAEFIQDNRIRSFNKLLSYTKEDFLRKKLKPHDIRIIEAFLLPYSLQSDDDFPVF